MEAFLYTKKTSQAGCRLQSVIEPSIKDIDFKILGTLEELVFALTRPRIGSGRMVAILVADTRWDLVDFLSIAELMSDVWIILVLPNRNRDITSKAFLLRPRFLSYADDDFSDTAAVFEKMIEHAKSQSSIPLPSSDSRSIETAGN